jgi:ComF family protein
MSQTRWEMSFLHNPQPSGGSSLNLWQNWQEKTRSFLNLLFPPRCIICHQSGSCLCPACQDTIDYIRPPVCPRCGHPTSVPRLCHSCRKAPPQIDGIRAVGYLEGTLRTAIHRFKYSNMRLLAAPLGRLMRQYLLQNQLPVDIMVPVPLHPHRLRERGYNQAALLAKEVEKALGLPLLEGALVRVRSTRPQIGLNARERRENVREAFRCVDRGVMNGRRILLVDDVCTTGATLEACSLALREKGVGAVWGLVLARERWH